MKDKLQFWKNSPDKKAGEGTGDKVSNMDNYLILNKIKDWRKMLCNNWQSKFVLGNKTWKSIDDFYNYFPIKEIPTNNIDKILKLALLAKFTQDKNLKKMLLSTNDAELYLYKKKSVLQKELMIIRNCIKKYDKYNLKDMTKFSYNLISKILNIKNISYKFNVNDKVYIKNIKQHGYIIAIYSNNLYEIKLDNGKKIDKVPYNYLIPRIIIKVNNIDNYGYITSINNNFDKITYNILLDNGKIFENIEEKKIIKDTLKKQIETCLESIMYRFPWFTPEQALKKLEDEENKNLKLNKY